MAMDKSTKLLPKALDKALHKAVVCPHCQKRHRVPVWVVEHEPVWRDSLRYVTWLTLSTGMVGVALRMTALQNPPYWMAPLVGLGVALTVELARLHLIRPVEPAGGHKSKEKPKLA